MAQSRVGYNPPKNDLPKKFLIPIKFYENLICFAVTLKKNFIFAFLKMQS